MAGGQDNLIKAEARYRDFVNRFPTSERAAYAQFQIGLTLSRRIAKPDRDQSISMQAVQALEDVERFYPTSEYAAQAKEEAERVRARLAEHDYMVGRFYKRYGLPNSRSTATNTCWRTFPITPRRTRCSTICARRTSRGRRPATSSSRARPASASRSEYPESQYVEKIPKNWPEEPEPKQPKQLEAEEGKGRRGARGDRRWRCSFSYSQPSCC